MVTDAELDTAAKETPMETPVETPASPEVIETPVTPEEPEDNTIRSNLGRKVKALDDQIADINNKFSRIEELLSKRAEPIEEDDDTPYLTVKQYQKIKKEEEQAVTQYNSDYIRAEVDVGLELEVTEKEHEEILKEVRENYFQKHSNDAKADAAKNYMKAYTAILKRKANGGKPNPLKGNPPSGPLGGLDPSKGGEPTEKTVKLDPHAAEFIKKMGLDDKWASNALEGELPTHLMGNKGRV